VIIDILSRYVVGWTLSTVESAEVAERLILATYVKEGIEPKSLPSRARGTCPAILRC